MAIRNFHFYKNKEGEWYFDWPAWKGDPDDLQMIEGADKWLDLISHNANEVDLAIALESFEGAEVLNLVRLKEENLGGGGIYELQYHADNEPNLTLWLCDVTEVIFGLIPEQIYFRTVNC